MLGVRDEISHSVSRPFKRVKESTKGNLIAYHERQKGRVFPVGAIHQFSQPTGASDSKKNSAAAELVNNAFRISDEKPGSPSPSNSIEHGAEEQRRGSGFDFTEA